MSRATKGEGCAAGWRSEDSGRTDQEGDVGAESLCQQRPAREELAPGKTPRPVTERSPGHWQGREMTTENAGGTQSPNDFKATVGSLETILSRWQTWEPDCRRRGQSYSHPGGWSRGWPWGRGRGDLGAALRSQAQGIRCDTGEGVRC